MFSGTSFPEQDPPQKENTSAKKIVAPSPHPSPHNEGGVERRELKSTPRASYGTDVNESCQRIKTRKNRETTKWRGQNVQEDR